MEQNREIKYRKIPSLDFLFEISSDGRYIRNVKSKKQLQIHWEPVIVDNEINGYWEYIFLGWRYGKRYIDNLRREAWCHDDRYIVDYGKSLSIYYSLLSCAEELAMRTGLSVNSTKKYLKEKRKLVRGIKIIYI